MNIKFIIGQAGTAKTTNLMKIASTLYKQKNSFVCLAYTHSAVNNMIEKFMNETHATHSVNKHFKTIHSYLNIVPTDTGYFRNSISIKHPSYVLVDEFSLIDLETLNILLSELSKVKELNLIFAGDILQLNPVNTNPVITYTLFKNITIQTDIATAILVGSHLSNNIYSNPIYESSKKMILTKNYRSDTDVMDILVKALNNDFGKIYYYKDEAIKNFINEGYVVLSSKYINLEKLYKHVDKTEYTILSRIGEINLDNELLLTKNINQNFTNGDIVKVQLTDNPDKIKLIKGEFETIIKKSNASSDNTGDDNTSQTFPLLPLNFYSIFKAQGKGFDNVIVVLDDMFEITMLYTAITRARKKVIFTHIHKLETVLQDIKLKNKAFNILKQIVYNDC